MTEPMKTATDILKSNGLISERETGIEVLYVHGHLSLVNALEQYAALKVAAERERILSEVREYVFWHDKFFNDTIVGQPPSLQPLRDLIKD